MKKIFNRNFTKGFIFNEINKDFSNTYRPSHIGVKIGKVVGINKDKIQIKLKDDLNQKDKNYDIIPTQGGGPIGKDRHNYTKS